jgi:hypothetical protein
LTTNYQENSKPDEDSSSEPEHLPNKNQNIEESEI